jgi:hypothetical protein
MPRTATNDATRAGIEAVARALLPELPAIGAGVAAHILAREPRFTRGAAEDLVRSSCQANTTTLLGGLLRDVPLEVLDPPVEVVHDTREFFQRGVSADTVERGYRLGIAFWCEFWAAAVRQHCPDPGVAVAVSSAGTTYLLGWLDRVLDQVGEQAREEAERLAREGVVAQVEELRRVLDGDADDDLAAASLRLGYDLTGSHLALVIRQAVPGRDGPPPDAAAREIASAMTAARPLVVRVDVATAWCWVPIGEATTPSVPVPPVAVVGGHGRIATGVEGFRSSHEEAREALRVALLADRAPATMTAYEHVAVTGLCTNDPDWARTFLVAQLGALAADNDEARRLRATLAAFFAADSGYRATAKRLGLHHNTIRYRLAQAEELLGRPLDNDRFALEVAVHLAAQLGPGFLAAGRPEPR